MVHTCKPPYEQLLIGVVAGGKLSLGGVIIIICILVVIDVAISTHNPTCKQLLTAGGRVLGCLGIILVVVVVTLSW